MEAYVSIYVNKRFSPVVSQLPIWTQKALTRTHNTFSLNTQLLYSMKYNIVCKRELQKTKGHVSVVTTVS